SGLEAGDAAEVRGHADAAADVGPDSERRKAGRDGGALASGRAARRMREAEGIGGLAEERVAALGVEAELGEVGAAEDDGAGLAQGRDQRGVRRRAIAGAADDAHGGGLALDVEVL